MRQRAVKWELAILVFLATVLAGTATLAVALATEPRQPGPSSSRIATDRDCEKPPAADPPALGPWLRAVPVAVVEEATSLALAPGGGTDGVLAQRTGQVRWVEAGEVTDEVVLDLSADTIDDGDGGLLSVAYDPDGYWLYAYRTTRALHDVVTAHRVDSTGRPDDTSGREILVLERPRSLQHHGGSMTFGADGMLYIGTGDGGGLGDPRENAQAPGELLGKVLRIDPTPGADRPYAIPSGNPFDRFGARPEIWVSGVRNPFRMSLDPATGDLWLGDVGQSCWEELNRLPDDAAGANLGWDRIEGLSRFEGGEVRGHHPPVLVQSHRDGWCAIVAGYVLRGSLIPELDGWLLFTDYCAGQLRAVRTDSPVGSPAEVRDLGVRVESPIAIVPGPDGHPWVLTLPGTIVELRLPGSP